MSTMRFHPTLRIASVAEVVRLTPRELSEWHILSVRGRMNDEALHLPGVKSVVTVFFDDVEADFPEDRLFAARPEDIRKALDYAREVGDEPLLIHCYAGVSRSPALAWVLVYARLLERRNAVREAFEMVREIRPVMLPNRHVLRLGVKALVPPADQNGILRQFQQCLNELNYPPEIHLPYSPR